MLKNVQRLLAAALVCASVGLNAGEPMSVATIDLKKVFSTFHKSKEAEIKVESARVQAKKELDERVSYWNGIEAQLASLTEEVNGPGLGGAQINVLVNRLNSKLRESQALREEIQSFGETREAQIAEMANRYRAAILEEINKVIAERVKNYDLVLDSSATSVDEVKIVLFYKPQLDLTEEIVVELARSVPVEKP